MGADSTREHFAALRALLISLQGEVAAALYAARTAAKPEGREGTAQAEVEADEEGARLQAIYDVRLRHVVQELQQIEEAFGRLRDGSYGGCVRCGELIPVALLSAQPTARLCAPCGST